MNKIEFLQHLHKVAIETSLFHPDLITLATIAQLQGNDGATIAELESTIGIGYMKQRIYRLEKAGLVDSDVIPRKAGRPLKFSKLTDKGLTIVNKLLLGPS